MKERDVRAAFTDGFEPERNQAGFNDDAAVVTVRGRVVLTTDAFRDGTHFPEGTRPEDAAYLAVAGTLSDIAGMGAEPIGVLVALGLPETTTLSTVERLAEGVRDCLDAHGGELLGGDTKPAPTLGIVTTGFGRLPKGGGLFRDRAEPGDALCVTGPLGGAGAALERLQNGLIEPHEATPLMRPTPRVRTGLKLAQLGVQAGLDLSDGLAAGALQLAEASNACVEVASTRIPLHEWASAAGRRQGLAWALETGGDYELLVTVPERLLDRAHRSARATGAELTVVGRVTDGAGATLVSVDGKRRELKEGFVHRVGR